MPEPDEPDRMPENAETRVPDATDPTPEDASTSAAPVDRTRARRVALLSLRLVAGTVAVVAAAATVAAVGLVPVPAVGVDAPSATVSPVPADELRTCAGSALRLGDETGADADTPVVIGLPAVRADAVGADLERTNLPTSDAGNGGSSSAPSVLRVAPGEGVDLAGAQSQAVDARDFKGFTTAGCAEPSGSIWLVGGATTVGRTSILSISNPTEVGAEVTVEIFGEDGKVEAPGMAGIDVPAGSQRVLSLAGFAPGLVSPVVHVEARGGQVVAYLQQSIVRGLDATGMDLVDASPDPSTEMVFPGVRILDSISTSRAASLEDWDDVAPVVRIFNPGAEATEVTVEVTPLDTSIEGTGFPVQAEPGIVTEVALDAGTEVDSGVALADGTYTVTMSSEQPFVGGVRVSAAADIGEIETPGIIPAPPTDVAWYSAAAPLDGDSLVTIAPGPDPILVAVNPTASEVSLVLDAQVGEDITVVVPAGGAVSTSVVVDESYLLTGAEGVMVAVSYAADDAMGAYPVTDARPVSGSIVIRP